jgi:hypothetical protein
LVKEGVIGSGSLKTQYHQLMEEYLMVDFGMERFP